MGSRKKNTGLNLSPSSTLALSAVGISLILATIFMWTIITNPAEYAACFVTTAINSGSVGMIIILLKYYGNIW